MTDEEKMRVREAAARAHRERYPIHRLNWAGGAHWVCREMYCAATWGTEEDKLRWPEDE